MVSYILLQLSVRRNDLIVEVECDSESDVPDDIADRFLKLIYFLVLIFFQQGFETNMGIDCTIPEIPN